MLGGLEPLGPVAEAAFAVSAFAVAATVAAAATTEGHVARELPVKVEIQVPFPRRAGQRYRRRCRRWRHEVATVVSVISVIPPVVISLRLLRGFGIIVVVGAVPTGNDRAAVISGNPATEGAEAEKTEPRLAVLEGSSFRRTVLLFLSPLRARVARGNKTKETNKQTKKTNKAERVRNSTDNKRRSAADNRS